MSGNYRLVKRKKNVMGIIHFSYGIHEAVHDSSNHCTGISENPIALEFDCFENINEQLSKIRRAAQLRILIYEDFYNEKNDH